MKAELVNPQKWSDKKVLFDDGEFSVIYGKYENGNPVLGVRWNGEDDEVGHPRQGKYPTWLVFPESFSLSLVRDIIEKLGILPDSDADKAVYLKNSIEAEKYFKELATR